ncbi:54S ribosomal protein L41, mitochondrial [[Candida] railenensis]|uniref:Large ribosomal subunit protein uL23m n=1 Tax=[Candida] railenensis TaxID=45579 RepID=A0A9P0QLV7_9ASCO|nr:54S ribosomal protein L41, mitochondrial [[Candida] railenensis]
MSSFWNAIRFAHFKPLKNYPKINVNDVTLDRPALQKGPIRRKLISQEVTDSLFPATEITRLYKEAGKPIPRKFNTKSELISRRNFEFQQEAFRTGDAHFRLGEKNVYFPKARIVLLRPNAKHTPYQAKFLVPRNFNRLDLRDYLFHVYGLRALNVTVQLLHTKWTRNRHDYARFRGPQFKKMTIDMEEPFIWPEVPKELAEEAQTVRDNQIKVIEHNFKKGSDKKNKPKAFDGLYVRPKLADNFVPRSTRDKGAKELENFNRKSEEVENKKVLSQFLNL